MNNRFEYYYFGDDRERVVAVEHYLRVRHQINLRYELRASMDPFAISVYEFKKLYRLPQHLVMELVGIIAPYVAVRTYPISIPVERKVLIALSFYASGSYQRVIGRAADLSVSQSMVSYAINEITEAFNIPEVLMRFIHFPNTREERENTIRRLSNSEVSFRNLHMGLPRCLGSVDCTLIKIVPPPYEAYQQAYYCRKGYTALNVQIVCDAQLKILDINSRYPGSSHDAFIYRYSGLRAEMQMAYEQSRCWLLGDSGYSLEPWLHTQIPNAAPGTPEFTYTRVQCHCRNPIERCNGVLKARWRCLRSDRVLYYRPEKAGMIVNACACLHNFCINRNLDRPRPVENDEGVDGGEEDDVDDFEENMNLRLRQQALRERQFLINYVQEHHQV